MCVGLELDPARHRQRLVEEVERRRELLALPPARHQVGDERRPVLGHPEGREHADLHRGAVGVREQPRRVVGLQQLAGQRVLLVEPPRAKQYVRDALDRRASVRMVTAPTISTLGELRASGHVHKPLRIEIRDNLLAAPRATGARPVAGPARLRRHRDPAARAGADRRPRRRAARRARPGQDPAAAHPGRAARRVDAGHLRLRARRAPLRARSPTRSKRRGGVVRRRPARSRGGTATSGTPRSWPPRTPRRRPDRRRRPDEGGRGPLARRPRDHPLRPDPAHPPRHRGDQRAARPRRADPGRDAQRDGGARHPDPRLRAAAAARRARRRQRQPRGLHQPRPHHHPAQGPLRRRDPHPLPDRARATRSP